MIDEKKSLAGGCIIPYRNQEKENLNNGMLEQTCQFYHIDMNVPFETLPFEQKKIILYGSPDLIDFKLRSTSGRIHDKKIIMKESLPTSNVVIWKPAAIGFVILSKVIWSNVLVKLAMAQDSIRVFSIFLFKTKIFTMSVRCRSKICISGFPIYS